MHPRCSRPPVGNIVGPLYHKLYTQSSAPEDGQNNCPKYVELTGIIIKPLLLHLVGCLYYLYQWCTVKQISDNEIYLLIKYIKSVLWRVAKRLSIYIQDARCLKVKARERAFKQFKSPVLNVLKRGIILSWIVGKIHCSKERAADRATTDVSLQISSNFYFKFWL